MGLTWGPSGANGTQVGPMLVPWTLLSGQIREPKLCWWKVEVQQKDYQQTGIKVIEWLILTHCGLSLPYGIIKIMACSINILLFLKSYLPNWIQTFQLFPNFRNMFRKYGLCSGQIMPKFWNFFHNYSLKHLCVPKIWQKILKFLV